MIRFLPAILAWLLFIGSSHARATDIPAGNVSGVWTADGNPYNILGNIRVAPGESLEIQPGVQVNFTGSYFLRVLGNFEASGAPGDSITFTWASGGGNIGFRLDSLQAASDTARFNHCRISNMQSGKISIVNGSKVVFENSRVHHCTGHSSGLFYIANATGIHIRNNYFHNNATGSSSYGGVIYIADASPVISNNYFRNNTATFSGGAISIWRNNVATTPLIQNNVFRANSAPSAGAIDIRSNVVPTITGNEFDLNFASVSGGAIWQAYVQAGVIEYSNNTFTQNSANMQGGAIRSIECKVNFNGDNFQANQSNNNNGGGIFFNDGNIATVTNCTFSNNSAAQGGAVIVDDFADIAFNRCTFTNNQATNGGAVALVYNITASFDNCLFANNEASNVGGALRVVQFTAPTITNCTFANNHAAGNGGVASLYWDSDPNFYNCILWGNTAQGGGLIAVQDYLANYCSPSFVNSTVQGGLTSLALGTSPLGIVTNMIEDDPLFVMPSAGSGASFEIQDTDFHVQAFSPCLDAGENNFVFSSFDLSGAARIQNQTVDQGCYEGFGVIPEPFPTEIDLNEDGVLTIDDFLLFIADYGCTINCIADFDGDGVVSVTDMIYFLSLFGL
jgi:predicted outer membrane repeat protein